MEKLPKNTSEAIRFAGGVSKIIREVEERMGILSQNLARAADLISFYETELAEIATPKVLITSAIGRETKQKLQSRTAKTMNDKCYSYNEEDFSGDFSYAVDRAVEYFLDDNPEFEGEAEIEIFEADKVKNTISKFLGTCIADVLAETACDDDDGGEAAEGWASRMLKSHKEIQSIVSTALENWADQTINQPNFFGAKNVRPISVKIKVDKDGNWEDITP